MMCACGLTAPPHPPPPLQLVSGIGNYLADEVLYQARIHPESYASVLRPEDVSSLRASIVSVLDIACAADADYKHFPPDWLFHFRWGKGKDGSTMPDGSHITFITVGGRTSAVVLKRQGAPRKGAARGGKTGASVEAGAGAGAGAGAAGECRWR